MKYINENNGALTQFQNRDYLRGIPYYGQKGDFNFVLGRSQFTPGISIKVLPLSDMSRKADSGISEFENNVNMIKKYYKPGDRVRGILVNSQLDDKNGRTVIGKLQRIKVDHADNTIRVFIKDPKTLQIKEIYVDTMERLFESSHMAMTFSQFLAS